MVAPVIAGAGIGAVGSLAEGILGKRSDKKAADRSYKRQKEFAKHAIQWKAQDARAAGLHPLFAMGAGTANYQPSFIAGQDPMGSAISDSAQQLGKAYAQSKAPPPGTPAGPIGQAQLESINAQTGRDNAQAALYLSQAKRNEQVSNTTQDGDLYSSTLVDPPELKVRKMAPTTPVKVMGKAIDPNRGWSDAEEIENRYGDVASWLYGLGVIGADSKKAFVKYGKKRAKRAPLPKRRKPRGQRYGAM